VNQHPATGHCWFSICLSDLKSPIPRRHQPQLALHDAEKAFCLVLHSVGHTAASATGCKISSAIGQILAPRCTRRAKTQYTASDWASPAPLDIQARGPATIIGMALIRKHIPSMIQRNIKILNIDTLRHIARKCRPKHTHPTPIPHVQGWLRKRGSTRRHWIP